MIVSPYKSLVEASASLSDVDFFDCIDASNISQATRLLNDVGPALESARQWLNHRCEVPIDHECDFLPHHMDDLQHLRNLSRGFRMEGDIAAFSEDHASVAGTGIDILELANAVRRGGLIIDLLVGIAISGVAIDRLRKSRERFDGGTRSCVVDALLRHERERDLFADVVKRDARWESLTGYEEPASELSEREFIDLPDFGLSEVERQELLRFVQHYGDRPEYERHAMYLDQDRHALALMRMLTVDLALRDWHATEGAFPSKLSDLSPALLADVPLDPFTNSDFVYRVDGCDSFILYSTGPDAVDAGGRFGPWQAVCDGGFDLCLDADDLWTDCSVRSEQTGIAGRLRLLARSWRSRWESQS